jgi:hypothetical protein
LAEQFRIQHGATWQELLNGPNTVYIDREVEIDRPVPIPMPVPMPFVQSVASSFADFRSVPGCFIWLMVIVALLDVVCRATAG